MTLLGIYKNKNGNVDWVEKFSSLAKNNKGSVFKCINTNFRTQKSFIHQFESFESIEGVGRDEWPVQDTNKQEYDKQRVVKLLEAKLFQEFKNGGLRYKKTKKGVSYRKYIDYEFSEDEKWIVNYLYLVNGNYTNEKNHIIEKTREILKLFQLLKLEDEISTLFKKALSAGNVKELVKEDLFYVMSFYDDVEFLEIYFNSTKEEKTELQKYIIKNYEEQNNLCCVSKKYRSGGNYRYNMAIDEIKVFYTTHLLIKAKTENLQETFACLLNMYKENFKIDKEKILTYIKEEDEIFEAILLDVFEIEEDIVEITTDEDIRDESPLDYIDTTTKEGRMVASQIFSKKKKKVRELAQYKCSLEKYRSCEKHYFTSKMTNKNYIEVHHLIPKEYSNRFSHSIEVIPNYVTLCPSCHQLVHKAVDRERKDHLTKLLSDRKENLSHLNLVIETDELLEFYKVDI